MTQVSCLFLSFLALSRVFDVFILMAEEDNEHELLDQVYSDTRVPTQVNTNQHESDTNQHESNTSQHESTRVWHESTRVNTTKKLS